MPLNIFLILLKEAEKHTQAIFLNCRFQYLKFEVTVAINVL